MSKQDKSEIPDERAIRILSRPSATCRSTEDGMWGDKLPDGKRLWP